MFIEKKKEIDNLEFGVTPFPAAEAIKLQAHLLKLFGSSLGALLGAVQKENSNGIEIDGNAVGNSLQFLFQQLDESTLFALIKRLFKNVTCQYIPAEGAKEIIIDFSENFDERLDVIFQGKLLTIYKVIWFVLEVNYPDFFVKIGSVFGNRIRTALSPKASNAEEAKLNA